MSADTSTGMDASEAWLAASVMVFLVFILADIIASLSGWIIRSPLEI